MRIPQSTPTNMPDTFERKKDDILRQLSVADADYTDLSPKGSVDEGILDLVHEINRQEGYVTTSSCAGRIAVFLEGDGRTDPSSTSPPSLNSADLPSAGGKGGGSWLYVSHDPVDPESLDAPGQLFALFFGLPAASPTSYPAPGQPCRFVHFKFEPMILHILTADLPHAQRAYTAAMAAGFRESGIGLGSGAGATPMVAVRTAGLAFDNVVAYRDAGGVLRPMVTEECLRVLVRIANARFAGNVERRERFATALMSSASKQDGEEWEPAEARRARKRAEGLRRRNELAHEGRGQDERLQVDEDIEIGSLGLMMNDPT